MTSTSGSDFASLTAAAATPKLPVTLDTQGRVRTSKEQRRLILAEFERSGVSAPQFAQQTGLKYSTFAGWVQRYRRAKRPGLTPPVRLLEAVVGPAPLRLALEVHLPGGLSMPPLRTAAPAQSGPARPSVVQVAHNKDGIVAQTADGDININQKKVVRPKFTREPVDITEATAHQIQELLRELVRTEQLAGKEASYGGWQNHLKNVFKVESYRKLTVEQGEQAIKWLKQELGRMAPSLRRTNNPEWRKRMYNDIWASARELGWSHDQVHAFANAELDLQKPITSLTELGEQKLELLRDKLRYRARRGR